MANNSWWIMKGCINPNERTDRCCGFGFDWLVAGNDGGFLIVPALCLWARLPMKKAIGTTLTIISVNSLFGFLNSYLTVAIDWSLLMQFSIGSTLGILMGSKIAEMISGNALKKVFGWFVLTISLLIASKQFFL